MNDSPPAVSVRRAVKRAAAGVTLDESEVTALLHTEGEDLEALFDIAASVRAAHLAHEGRPGTVTYSRKVFIPLTRLCRDRCHYCTFATVPGKLPAPFLEVEEVVDIAAKGAEQRCKEALFTLGDRPEARWPQARQWLDERGYDSTIEYLRACAVAVLERTGLLPHLNPGVMSWEELQLLRPVAPSMGMMLETTSRRLWAERGGPHFGSPDKEPAVRLRVLDDAGRSGIPFTTGILIGIGEWSSERADSLLQIRRRARQFHHIQEVIVQNFRAKPDTAMRSAPDADLRDLARTVAVARILMPPGVSVQAPPNLVGSDHALLLRAGIDDWGGVSPLTPDHVNPERPWPQVEALAGWTAESGFELRERLTVYPRYVRGAERWVDARLHPHVAALVRGEGLTSAEVRPLGLTWQEPDGGLDTYGRADLNVEIDDVGRTSDRRGDFDDVYGDWDILRAQRAALPALPTLDSDVRAGLRLASASPASLLDPPHRSAALALLTCDGHALELLAGLADDVRSDLVGDDITYVVNRNINFSNVCYVGCRFCAFAQRERDADAFRLSIDEVARRAVEAAEAGATEVCMQGGIDPQLPVSYYADVVRAIKTAVPSMHVHAFSPMEIVSAASKAGISVSEWLSELRDAGLGSIPGTAAEILDDEVRWILTKGKLPTATWVDVVTTAHRLGIPSSSTMMYGHVDHPGHWLTHLRVLAGIADDTGGFTEFVGLPFVHGNAPIYLAGVARPGPSVRDNRAVHAFARLALAGRIANIQCSWVKLGDAGTAQLLRGGANDVGGTLMEETISRMAGSEHGSSRDPGELEDLARLAGRPARQRTTTYDLVG